MRRGPTDRRARIAAGALVAALHLAILALLLMPGERKAAEREGPGLATYDVPPPVMPPPVLPPMLPRAVKPASGAAAPAGRRAERTAVVAPEPVVVPPSPPVVAAAIAGRGDQASGGAAAAGVGIGAGGSGSGAGGGAGHKARLIAGAIRDRDYPKAERRARVEGSTTVRFIVGTDGRVRDCAIARSSGSAALDSATCTLIAARFRYAPATDAAGRTVAEERGWRQDWWLEPR